MNTKKATKRALLTSVMALVMCVVMLVGTTFAWFTDTASTAVNRIQAGTLDVGLEMANGWDEDGNPIRWTNAEGETLSWKKAAGAPADEKVLWEPGCRYQLPELRIVNNGNLALKYRIVINGIVGNAKLLEAIEFTYGGVNDINAEYTLAPEATSNNIVIEGHMREDAGNEYQGLSIDGIGITVVATQVDSEFDSFDNQYDKDAPLQVNAKGVGDISVTNGSSQNSAEVSTEKTISSGDMSVTYPAGVKLSNTGEVTGDTKKKTSVTQELKYVGDTPSAALTGISIDNGKAVASYELTLPVSNDNSTPVTVTIKYPAGLTGVQVYHSGTLLTTTANANGESATYDAATGVLTLTLKHASPIDIVYNAVNPTTATVTNQEELEAAFDNTDITTIKLGADFNLTKVLAVTHSVTVDFCGKTITASGEEIDDEQYAIQIVNNSVTSNKLTFKDSVGGGKFACSYGGVKLMSSRAGFELNDVTMTSNKGHAVEIYSLGFVISDDWSGVTGTEAISGASIVMNSGKIVTPADGGSSNGALHGGSQWQETENRNSVTINGGEIIVREVYTGIYCGTNVDLTINGGTFTSAEGEEIIFIAYGDVVTKIAGGNFTVSGSSKIGDIINKSGSSAANAVIEITGGTYSADPSAYVDTANYNVTHSGSTWTVTAK